MDTQVADRLHELATSAADHGGWEEFHQKRGNFTMFGYHKGRRLALEAEYRTLKARSIATVAPAAF